MGKKATKAADNVYCIARYKAAEEESRFNSRESTAELIGMDRTRLARLEELQRISMNAQALQL